VQDLRSPYVDTLVIEILKTEIIPKGNLDCLAISDERDFFTFADFLMH
jgi:hypothetical protein